MGLRFGCTTVIQRLSTGYQPVTNSYQPVTRVGMWEGISRPGNGRDGMGGKDP